MFIRIKTRKHNETISKQTQKVDSVEIINSVFTYLVIYLPYLQLAMKSPCPYLVGLT